MAPLELAAAAATVTAPDRALDVEIAKAAGWREVTTTFPGGREMPCSVRPGEPGRGLPGPLSVFAPAFTGSLDAATSLAAAIGGATVFWRSGHDGVGPEPWRFYAEVLVCRDLESVTYRAVADTEPLARSAACLRAIAAEAGQ